MSHDLPESERLPRLRVESVIAGGRVVLAVGAFVAVWLDPSIPAAGPALTYSLFISYAFYSLLVFAVVRRHAGFTPIAQFALHAYDLAAFTIFIFLTQGVTSPFFVYFVFSVVCGALRWDSRGAIATAAVSIAAYLFIGLSGVEYPREEFDRFLIRSVQLIVVAGLLSYLSVYHPEVRREMRALASWPHRLPRDMRDVAEEILGQAGMILRGRVVLMWENPDDGHTQVVWINEGRIDSESNEASTDAIIGAALTHDNFQIFDAGGTNSRVRWWSGHSFSVVRGTDLELSFRRRFDVRSIQVCRLRGEVVRGRICWINMRSMRGVDLLMGGLVARLAATRLDSLYLLHRLKESAALKERLRVARDLHDSVLQTLAATALQLAAAERLLDGTAVDAHERLKAAREHLEFTEQEMRSLIRRLRPVPPNILAVRHETLPTRLQELRRRLRDQWQVELEIQMSSLTDLSPSLADQVMFIVNEAVLNAARHARASVIRVGLTSNGRDDVLIRVHDNGRGFPFEGKYDLDALNALGRGPRTLKERVSELGGDLHITTGKSGTALLATLPMGGSTALS